MKPIILCILFLGGCATSPMYVLDSEGYTVKRELKKWCEPGFFSPSTCITTLADYRDDGKTSRETRLYVFPAATSGFGQVLTGSAAAVGASHLIGQGLRRSGGDMFIENSSDNNSGASSLQQQNQVQTQ